MIILKYLVAWPLLVLYSMELSFYQEPKKMLLGYKEGTKRYVRYDLHSIFQEMSFCTKLCFPLQHHLLIFKTKSP